MSLNAVQDVLAGLRARDMWWTRAIWDIKRRYSESLLGPIWIAGGLATMSAAIGLLYARVFGIHREAILPWITAGFLVWYLISTSIGGATSIFAMNRAAILHSAGPMSPHIFRLVSRELLVFAHNIGVFLIVAVIYGILTSIQIWWLPPALALVLINVAWMALIVACLSVLYADIPPIVQYGTLLAMFITPLFWIPGVAGRGRNLGDTAVLDFNPFYYLVTVVREPLLGRTPELNIWIGCVVLALVGWAAALLVFQSTRRKIALAL
ncbi:ABC transporter permease [Brevundimonas sp.]|uniref:ABC transporter permease n=1 Tax=Brevundimonas sp. TaxID=1871086 RepID=UPI0025FA2B9B|nr:ABC transporter permease [Brevundimonas sp.]